MSLCNAEPDLAGEPARPSAEEALPGRPLSTGRAGAAAVSLPGMPRSAGTAGLIPEAAGAAATAASTGSGAVGGRGDGLRPLSDELVAALAADGVDGRPPRGDDGRAVDEGRGDPERGGGPARGDERLSSPRRGDAPRGEPDLID